MADKVAPIKSGEYVSFEEMKTEADLTYDKQGAAQEQSTDVLDARRDELRRDHEYDSCLLLSGHRRG